MLQSKYRTPAEKASFFRLPSLGVDSMHLHERSQLIWSSAFLGLVQSFFFSLNVHVCAARHHAVTQQQAVRQRTHARAHTCTRAPHAPCVAAELSLRARVLCASVVMATDDVSAPRPITDQIEMARRYGCS